MQKIGLPIPDRWSFSGHDRLRLDNGWFVSLRLNRSLGENNQSLAQPDRSSPALSQRVRRLTRMAGWRRQ
jgi:hypothetical protein